MSREKINPFYDSNFLVAKESDEDRELRLLVELNEDELIQLRNEIDAVLEHYKENNEVAEGA